VLLASGVKPCSEFRVWVRHQPGDTPAAAAVEWSDVTASAVPLPTVQDELVLPVRDFE
jgi:hypothetical protein